jgi:hypothetical protein
MTTDLNTMTDAHTPERSSEQLLLAIADEMDRPSKHGDTTCLSADGCREIAAEIAALRARVAELEREMYERGVYDREHAKEPRL